MTQREKYIKWTPNPDKSGGWYADMIENAGRRIHQVRPDNYSSISDNFFDYVTYDEYVSIYKEITKEDDEIISKILKGRQPNKLPEFKTIADDIKTKMKEERGTNPASVPNLGTVMRSYLRFLYFSENPEEISEPNTTNTPTNVIYYGVPGSGKSFIINEEVKDFEVKDPNSVERVVFHPDYSYSDFVGQILPKIDDSGVVKYEFTPGPFTRIVAHAIANPGIIHYLIIEEINRGNAAAIFGDIFQLLDRDKNTKYSITNKDIADEIRNIDPDSDYLNGDKLVGLPKNLQLRATMNTSDQNVFTLDNAFQRRWHMKLVENKIQDNHEFKDVEIRGVKWEQFHSGINSIIANQLKELGSAEDKLIGPYFVSEREISDERLFAEKVFKYLWNDVFSFDKKDIFRDNLDTLEQVINEFMNSGFGGVFTAQILKELEKDSAIAETNSTNDEENSEQ
ncbi:MAG: AAA domain-containing protein [Methanobrevibacter sp. CfCl-M3]